MSDAVNRAMNQTCLTSHPLSLVEAALIKDVVLPRSQACADASAHLQRYEKQSVLARPSKGRVAALLRAYEAAERCAVQELLRREGPVLPPRVFVRCVADIDARRQVEAVSLSERDGVLSRVGSNALH